MTEEECKHGKLICYECIGEDTAVSESPSVTGYEALLDFAKWCVNNFVCDCWDEALGYTEEFCKSPQCRRCSAKRVLDKIAS